MTSEIQDPVSLGGTQGTPSNERLKDSARVLSSVLPSSEKSIIGAPEATQTTEANPSNASLPIDGKVVNVEESAPEISNEGKKTKESDFVVEVKAEMVKIEITQPSSETHKVSTGEVPESKTKGKKPNNQEVKQEDKTPAPYTVMTRRRSQSAAINVEDDSQNPSKKSKKGADEVPKASHSQSGFSVKKRSEDGWDTTIQQALKDLSSSQQELVAKMEIETKYVAEKLPEENQKVKEAKMSIAEAELEVRKAEEALRTARSAHRKMVHSSKSNEEKAREAKFEAEEAKLRLKELKKFQEEEKSVFAGRLVVQKNNAALAFKDFQQKAQDLASIEGIDELHSEEGLNLAETKMKSLNSLWLRFTIERRKFLEAAASMKTKK